MEGRVRSILECGPIICFFGTENNRGILAEMGAVPLLSKVILHPFDEVNDTGVQKELALASRAIGNMCYEHGSVLVRVHSLVLTK